MTEHAEQASVIEWKAWQLNLGHWPELALLHAIPNGGWRALTTAIRLKAEGVLAAIPDLFLPVPRGGFHGMYIEMKMKGGDVRDDQWIMMDALRQQGYYVTVCWNGEQAIRMLETYLSLDKDTHNANSEEDLQAGRAQADAARERQASKAGGTTRRARQRRPGRGVRTTPW